MRNRFASTKKRARSGVWGSILPVLFFCALIGVFYMGVNSISTVGKVEQLESARRAVTRATIQCYALEGQYPPNVDYLYDHYGLNVDQTQYIIHYDAFATNIMPQIDVLPYQF